MSRKININKTYRTIVKRQSSTFLSDIKEKHIMKKKLSNIERIAKLKRVANENYHESGTLRKKYFISALHCGDALLELKDLIRKTLGYGHWQEWLQDNFDGSYETAKVYMSIAKNWNDPRIVEARETMTIESIKGFQDVLKGKPYITPDVRVVQVTENVVYERYRKGIIADFTKEVNSLGRWKHWSRRYELFVLGDYFQYFWNKLHVELKRVTAKGRTKQRIDRSLRKAVRASGIESKKTKE